MLCLSLINGVGPVIISLPIAAGLILDLWAFWRLIAIFVFVCLLSVFLARGWIWESSETVGWPTLMI